MVPIEKREMLHLSLVLTLLYHSNNSSQGFKRYLKKKSTKTSCHQHCGVTEYLGRHSTARKQRPHSHVASGLRQLSKEVAQTVAFRTRGRIPQ